MSQTFQQLQSFIAQQTARKPRSVRTKDQSKGETANELTRKIVRYIKANGGFATRLSSTGVYRDDLKKFVPSQQRAGMPDVFGVVSGLTVLVEVKVGRDVLSEQQIRTISDLERAGAYVCVARTFQEFSDWFADLTRPSLD